MSAPAPHYLLFSQAQGVSPTSRSQSRWRFVLEDVDGGKKLEAADHEPGTGGERLELLAVVRGLEALDQPSRVTLVTGSRYVNEGLRNGLAEWRDSEWQWESYGKMVPIKNQDLWQRIDRACRIHRVDCRILRVDEPQAPHDPAESAGAYLASDSPSIHAAQAKRFRRFDERESVPSIPARWSAATPLTHVWNWLLAHLSSRPLPTG